MLTPLHQEADSNEGPLSGGTRRTLMDCRRRMSSRSRSHCLFSSACSFLSSASERSSASSRDAALRSVACFGSSAHTPQACQDVTAS